MKTNYHDTQGSHFYVEIQGLFKDFQRPLSCIFKDQLSTKFTTCSRTAIFNVYYCDDGTVIT